MTDDRDVTAGDLNVTADDRDVAVVGGGAVGTTAAYDLAAAGATVTLYERGAIAGGSTGLAAGVLYDAFADPVDAGVGGRALDRFRAFSGKGDFEFVETPYVWFARKGDEENATAIREQVPRMAAAGVDVELADPADLDVEFPYLSVDDVGVAALARNAGWTDPRSYADLLAAKAEDAGTEIRTGVEAGVSVDPPGVVVDGETTPHDAVIVATGAHTGRLLADAGVPVPLKPYRVQALVHDHDPAGIPMCYDATGGYYLRPHPAGLLAGDGTVPVEQDPDDWKRDADRSFVETMADRLARRLASFEPDCREAWAGLCVATPDGDPLLGELRDGLHVAAGWQGHGFMRAPALGEAIARDVLDEGGIDAFDPTRFDGDEEFAIVEGMTLTE
jgi:sarcosine oxidase subunit beta